MNPKDPALHGLFGASLPGLGKMAVALFAYQEASRLQPQQVSEYLPVDCHVSPAPLARVEGVDLRSLPPSTDAVGRGGGKALSAATTTMNVQLCRTCRSDPFIQWMPEHAAGPCD